MKEIKLKIGELIFDPNSTTKMEELFGKDFVHGLQDCLIDIFALYGEGKCPVEKIKNFPKPDPNKHDSELTFEEKIARLRDKLKKLCPHLKESDIDSEIAIIFSTLNEPKPSSILRFLTNTLIKQAIAKVPVEATYIQFQLGAGFCHGYLINQLKQLPIFIMQLVGNGTYNVKPYLFDLDWTESLQNGVNNFYFDQRGRFCVDFLGREVEMTFLIKNKDGSANVYKMRFHFYEKYHLENGVYVLDEAGVKGASGNAKTDAVIETCINGLLSASNPLPDDLGKVGSAAKTDPEGYSKLVGTFYDSEKEVSELLLAAAKKLKPVGGEEVLSDIEQMKFLPIDLNALEQERQQAVFAANELAKKKQTDVAQKAPEHKITATSDQSKPEANPVLPVATVAPTAKTSSASSVKLPRHLLTKEKAAELRKEQQQKLEIAKRSGTVLQSDQQQGKAELQATSIELGRLVVGISGIGEEVMEHQEQTQRQHPRKNENATRG